MPIYASLTAAYAKAIYLDGTKKFTDIRAEYVQAVKEYAAANYSDERIQNALDKMWIAQTEYDETMAIKYPPAPA